MKNILHRFIKPLGTQHAVEEEFVSALCSPPSKIGTLGLFVSSYEFFLSRHRMLVIL
jgi:hypothetical protein